MITIPLHHNPGCHIEWTLSEQRYRTIITTWQGELSRAEWPVFAIGLVYKDPIAIPVAGFTANGLFDYAPMPSNIGPCDRWFVGINPICFGAEAAEKIMHHNLDAVEAYWMTQFRDASKHRVELNYMGPRLYSLEKITEGIIDRNHKPDQGWHLSW